jgi:hypothetical protein
MTQDDSRERLKKGGPVARSLFSNDIPTTPELDAWITTSLGDNLFSIAALESRPPGINAMHRVFLVHQSSSTRNPGELALSEATTLQSIFVCTSNRGPLSSRTAISSSFRNSWLLL